MDRPTPTPVRFLSTPSARRATQHSTGRASRMQYFYPRPPRGGRHPLGCFSTHLFAISIHALREEGDRLPLQRNASRKDFYPRPPRGGRPVVLFPCFVQSQISIHALREEGDRGGQGLRSGQAISIHALREEGDPMTQKIDLNTEISIHALREEGDRLVCHWGQL